MPQVVIAAGVAGLASGGAAVLAASLGATGGLAALGFGGAFVIGFATTAVAGGLNYILAKKPSASITPQTRTVSVRNPAAAANVIYGSVRTGGTVVYLATTENNNYLHLVVVLAGHECEAVDEIYFNGKLSSEFDQFNVGSQFGLYWTGSFRSQFRNFVIDLDVVGVGLVQFAGASASAIAAAIDASQYFTATAPGPGVVEISAASSTVDFSVSRAVCDYYYGNQEDNAGQYTEQPAGVKALKIGENVFRVNVHLGADDQTADPDLKNELEEWGDNHRLRGLCYLYVRFKWSIDAWQGEIPSITARVRGKNDIYDPRGPSTGYTSNAALCAANYLCDEYGLRAVYADDIDEAALIAAANVCDEDVALDAGGTENRYEAHTVFASDADPARVIAQFEQAMAGRVNWSGGVAVIHPGSWRTPTLAFDENDLAGPLEVITGAPRDEVVNGVRGVFFSPDNNDQLDDFPPIASTTYMNEDGGERLWRDIELSMTASSAMAQRIAKIELLQARQDIVCAARFNMTAIQFRVGDVIQLSFARYGWTDKTFEVTSWTLTSRGGDDPQLVIDASLRETASSDYDWSTSEEGSYDPSPDTELQDIFVVQQVTALSIDSSEAQLFIGRDGTLFTRVRISWENPDAYVVRFRIEARNRAVGLWESYGETIETEFTFGPFVDGDRYDFRITSINFLGRESAPKLFINKLIVGKTSPPPDVDAFRVNRMADGTREYTWTYANPPADLAGFEIRSAPGLGDQWEEMETLETAPKDARRLESNQLAAGAYTVGIKAFDTTGNTSLNAVLVDSTLGNPRLLGALLYVDFAGLGWPGTKTDCWVDPFDGVLYPDSLKTWDDYSAWSGFTQWLEDPVPEFVYEHTVIDLGGRVVFTPIVSVIADADVTVLEKHSDDNVTFTSYTEIAGQLSARYVRFKVVFSTL